MITRREMLTGSAAALTTSAAIAPAQASPDVPAPAPTRVGKVHDAGMHLKFEMSDCYIHVRTTTTEAWDAEEGARNARRREIKDDRSAEADAERYELAGWSALHRDLDESREVAVRCELKPDEAERYRKVTGRDYPDPSAVARLRKIRGIVIDALERSRDVTSLEMTVGGNGEALFRVVVDDDIECDRRRLIEPVAIKLVFRGSADDI